MRFEDGFFKFVSGENEMTSVADAWLVHQNSLSIFKGDDFENKCLYLALVLFFC